MTKIKLIDDSNALAQCLEVASAANWVGVDTEFLREKTYYPLLCLIQVHTPFNTFCVDALAIKDLTPLELSFNGDAVKIIHSCRQDLEALDLRLDKPLRNLYDTQIAAAFCGHGEQVGYAALVESVCNVTLDKTHTRTDWRLRPLSPAQLKYAVDDVNYLNELRLFLNEELTRLGRVAWLEDECERILNLRDYDIKPEDAWKRLKGGSKIPPKHQQCAKQLAIWRETKAQKSDRPREWILPSQSLIDLCFKRPESINALNQIEGLSPGVIRNSGDEFIEIINTHEFDDNDNPVWSRHEAIDSEQKSQVKAIMKKLKQVAEDANISQSLLANRNDIEALVTGGDEIALLTGWRNDFVGKQIVAEFT